MSRTPWTLALYPRAYRRAHGDEIAAHYAESTAGASRTERRREAADVAGHALRVRLRLTSGDPLGRALAVAAPYAVTGAAAYALVVFAQMVMRVVWFRNPMFLPDGLSLGLITAADLILIGAGAAVLGGRWRAARRLTLLGTAAIAVQQAATGVYVLDGPSRLLSLALSLVLVLGCPPDIPPVGRPIRRAAGVFAAVTSLLLLVPVLGGGFVLFVSVIASVVPVLALSVVLAVAGPRSAAPGAYAAGIGLAVLPWLTYVVQMLRWEPEITGVLVALPAAGAAVAWARVRLARPAGAGG
ncbi:hypothetical protein ACFP1Z_28975 [Streptomyces gamaensis]|uniref:Uncharacterized protein n=1 Tax=Streptomyces gamaensis TaxID=1763542 RepID=A0ABW0Z8E8_9ACTN